MIFDKLKGQFVIYTNETGKIIRLPKDAAIYLKNISIGEDTSKLIDSSIIRKMSMYDDKITMHRTLLPDFPNALIKSSKRGSGLRMKLRFLSSELDFKIVLEIQKALILYKRTEKINRVNINEYLTILFEQEQLDENIKGSLSIIGDTNYEIGLSLYSFEVVLISALAMIDEVSFNGNVQLSLYGDKVNFLVLVPNDDDTENFREMCRKYPHLLSKLLLINSMCEDENTTINIISRRNETRISFALPIHTIKDKALESVSYDRERTAQIIKALFNTGRE